MPTSNPRLLFDKINPTCRSAMESAAGLALSRTHFEVEIEHWLFKLLDQPGADLPLVLKHLDADPAAVRRELDAALGRFKTGNGRAPALSQNILDLIREAWVIASVECGAGAVRSGHLLAAVLTEPRMKNWIANSSNTLSRLPGERLLTNLKALLGQLRSDETDAPPASGGGGGQAANGQAPAGGGTSKTPSLDQFTIDLTERAKSGKLDPVLGRDAEIRQLVDVLLRRRQNNPILVGEAGVGKTAVVEGLALRIAAKDVPPPLQNVLLKTLDLGLLQAGAGVKGEFENRLKNVIAEVKASAIPIVLFIDEAHTLIGAGGQQGQGDAANLLKPALARGELRTVAATTFAEYKKYFETDAALKRRFQPVRVDEPDLSRATRMLRGLVPTLEAHHKVRILDEAVSATVRLSARYMPDRQLPDKAVSLLDTVCARVSLSQSATPPALEDATREIEHLTAEIKFMEREGKTSVLSPERLDALRKRLTEAEANKATLAERQTKETKLVAEIRGLREKLEADDATADRTRLVAALAELAEVQGETPLVFPVVDAQAVAEVVSRQTGIPLGKMVRDELNTVLNMSVKLAERVVGQDHALDAIAQRIRTARADLADPRRPQGVFLLVGPSGVGKTETAMALADLLYGGDRNLVTVNMSEYKEPHKVSRLVGSAKGYVGYGEGGVLTNAVKTRPHSVVLLDEVEKAHESVQEIFYQVFDKGVLQNDTGEDVDFKNTIIILTSNVGTDAIAKATAGGKKRSAEELAEIIRTDLLKAFKPALLGRMTVVPYLPLADAVLKSIIRLKMNQIGDRLKQTYAASFQYGDDVVEAVAARCTEVETGARNVDHILTGGLLPRLAELVLSRLAAGTPVKSVTVGVGEDGDLTLTAE